MLNETTQSPNELYSPGRVLCSQTNCVALAAVSGTVQQDNTNQPVSALGWTNTVILTVFPTYIKLGRYFDTAMSSNSSADIYTDSDICKKLLSANLLDIFTSNVIFYLFHNKEYKETLFTF